MIDNCVIVTSLPRTGTTSICAMMETLGYRRYHAPLRNIFKLAKHGIAFADTPAFAYSVIEYFKNQNEINCKFVYVDRDFDSWFDSMTKSTNLLRTYHRFNNTPDDALKNDGERDDKRYYHEVFGDFDFNNKGIVRKHIEKCFYDHRDRVKDLGLVYKFSDGWPALCEFLGVNIPDRDIPHLHKQSIGSRK
jgi:hypothetical protein